MLRLQQTLQCLPKKNAKSRKSKAEATIISVPKLSKTQQNNGKSNGEMSLEDLRRTKSSPLVRNIAKEHGVDISRIEGSGMSGRVTKKDILSFIESGAALRPQDLLRKDAPSAPQTCSANSNTDCAKSGFYMRRN